MHNIELRWNSVPKRTRGRTVNRRWTALHGAQVHTPPAHGTFKQAQNVKKDQGLQGALDFDA